MNLTIGGVTCKSRTVRTVLKKLEPEEAKKVLDEKTQGVDARREKRMMKKGSAASSNPAPNKKIHLKLVPGPIKASTLVKDKKKRKGPAAASIVIRKELFEFNNTSED